MRAVAYSVRRKTILQLYRPILRKHAGQPIKSNLLCFICSFLQIACAYSLLFWWRISKTNYRSLDPAEFEMAMLKNCAKVYPGKPHQCAKAECCGPLYLIRLPRL
ncbi:hypothetical protein BDW75DRAFT_144072 [Aspergillus navahoensis]